MGQGILHVTNGDSAAGTIRQAGIPGRVSVWADVLHEGPVPPDDDLNSWLEIRAQFIAGAGWESHDRALAILREWAAILGGYAGYGEVVFWFEHDLFDQLLLIRHLAWLSRQPRLETAIRLICIGSYPGIERFVGLGQLTPEQIAPLFGIRTEVTAAQYGLARRAWEAFTSPDPRAIEAVLSAETSALPFLGAALGRFLEEYPDRHGLPRTERHVLECLEGGGLSPGRLFRSYSDREEARFMGDSVFWDRVLELGSEPDPLLRLSVTPGVGALPDGEVVITEAGRLLLAGRGDWLMVHRLHRWLGGVELDTARTHWRWDTHAHRLYLSAT